MQVEIVDNRSRHLVSVLSPAIEPSEDVRMAVAFVSARGLQMIEPSIMVAARAGGYLEFLVGLDMHWTEAEAVRALYELAEGSTNVALYCYASLGRGGMYHPKLYLARLGDAVSCVIGSSNLTGASVNRCVNAGQAASLSGWFGARTPLT